MKWSPATLVPLCLGIFLTPLVAEQVVFSEVMYNPSNGAPEFIEVQNLTSTPFDIALWEVKEGVTFTFPDFSGTDPTHTFLKAFERVVLCDTDPATFRTIYGLPEAIRVFGPWSGKLSDSGERISLEDKNGVTRCTLKYNDKGVWPVAADGTGHSLVLADTSRVIDDYRVWAASPSKGGTPGSPEPTLAEEPYPDPSINLTNGLPYVNYGDAWDFHDQNTDLGSAWKEVSYTYADAGWTRIGDAGNNGGLYGFETAAVPSPGMQSALLNSSNASNHLTYYLRKEFTYNGPTTGTSITIDQIIDDGAGYWLNGQWIGGVGTSSAAGHGTTATRVVTNATEELGLISVANPPLVDGVNVIATTLKQTNATSSDVVFGMRLNIAAPTASNLLVNEVLPSNNGGFIEIFNPTDSSITLSGYYLSDDPANLTKYLIPRSIIVSPNGLASVGFAESGFTPTATTTLYLTEPDGSTVTSALTTAMPLDGRSLGRKPAGSAAWFLFSSPTPALPNVSTGTSESSLAINEVHFDANGCADWIELHNLSDTTTSANGLWIASTRDFSDKIALDGNISEWGFASWDTAFPADNGEITLFLINSSDQVLDSVSVRSHSTRAHTAAFPDGSKEFYVSAAGSRDTSNDPDRQTSIVISELMVEPPSGHRDGEYVELYNKGSDSVDLTSWEFDKGIDYTFPSGTTLAAGAYVVIAANRTLTADAHPTATVIGDYSGNLANSGERLRLVDEWGNIADAFHYHTGGDWPALAAGQGSSMELRHPDMDNAMASAWADSDESNKSSFAAYSISETYEQLRTMGSPSDYEELHLHAVGDSHLALRNLSLKRNGTGASILPGNGEVVVTDGDGATGWLCQGTHHASHMNRTVFHLVSDGHGDVKANRCETDIIAIEQNDMLTFDFEARWISGKPTLIVATWDRSFGGIIRLPIPVNLGTPGSANSAVLATPRPTVSALRHQPAVPTSIDPVKVTARISAAIPLTSVNLRHRLDNSSGSNAWATTAMADDGLTQGDAIANDGLYTVTISDYLSDNSVVEFYVEATSAGGTSIQPSNAPVRPALWVVDDSTIAGDLRTERFVISARSLSALSGNGESPTFDFKFPRLSNHYFNATFIGDERDIIYNCELRKSGSPWTRASGSDLSRAKWKTPGDYRYRGYSRRSIDNDANGGRAYHNRIIRYWLYLFGHAASENEFIRVIVNGDSAAIREDVEPNSNDFLKRNWPDGELGELYRIDDEWWFDDNWSRQNRNADWSYKDTDEPERYQSEWIKRSREAEYDYGAFINWVKSVGEDDFTREEIERMADIDMMAANAVVRGWCDDWDTLTRNRGKNGYFFRRNTDHRWMLIQWDSDLTFGNSNAPFIGNLPGVGNFYSKPYIRQRVNYYLGEMVDKYTHNSARLTAWFQCEEAASPSYANNVGTYTTWNANRVGRAQTDIGSALTTNLTITPPGTTASNTITLTGTSPYNAFSIRAVGHPEAIGRFDSETSWTLTGIILQQGTNLITVQAVDANDIVVASTTTSVTKTGNAPPVMAVDADPGSFNVAVSKTLALDASASLDQEGSALSYSWVVNPSSQASLTAQNTSSTDVSFAKPGLYKISVTGTDVVLQESTLTREAAVYAASGWSSFSTPLLESYWSLENLVVRNGGTPNAWYSLDDRPGRLTLKLEGENALLLTQLSPQHPMIWRDLPPTTDWSFHTDIELATLQQGDFMVGLIVETEEAATTRYVFGMEDGDFISVKRAQGGSYLSLASVSWNNGKATIRVRRAGANLHFDYRGEPGQWFTIHTQPLSIGTQASQGGLFAATDVSEPVRFEFDYAMLVDPEATTDALEALRISELMYHPTEGGSLEYIELTNISSMNLDLDGVTFEATRPFDAFTFPSIVLSPNEYAVLVADTTAFQAQHGTAIRIVGQWAGGALSNSGERIVLRDSNGNVIHDFTYNDKAPWPEAADGKGPSLEVIDTRGNYNSPSNWFASTSGAGAPGSGPDQDADGLTDAEEGVLGTSINNADSDGDGMIDGAEVLAGTDPLNSNSLLEITSLVQNSTSGATTITWSTVPGKTYTVQINSGLNDESWTDVATMTATSLSLTIEDPSTTLSDARRFYRTILVNP